MAADCDVPAYLSASWKGVPFQVEQSEDTFGRRGEVYEYPLSNETAYKDLGRKARRFKVTGYLIGGQQVALTNAMALAAESPEPGMLLHPMFGPQLAACVSLRAKAEYKREVRRTRLDFDFVEAQPAMAPYALGATVAAVFAIASTALRAAERQATWAPTPENQAEAARVAHALASRIAPATDEAAWDAIDRLERPAEAYRAFADAAEPLELGTATVRCIHEDAAPRLKAWNAALVASPAESRHDSIESLILFARLALARDFALSSMQTAYATVGDALADLDFVVRLYDEEEAIAVHRCADELTVAIRGARAAAVRAILSANIRLPGVASTDVAGVWPSLVAAHKKFFDAARYRDVEAYNPAMNPFFVGTRIVAPAA